MNTARPLQLCLVAIFVLGFWLLAFEERSQFYRLLGLHAALFTLYARGFRLLEQLGFLWVLTLILGVRLPFYFNLPELSDDFYRFLWDGMLLCEGWSPFALPPGHVDLAGLPDPQGARILLEGMNSSPYTSVYPPLHQGFFALGHWFSGHSILTGVNAMRTVIVGFELLLMLWIFNKYSAMRTVAVAYLLNPLVVVEGVGNLHFEAAMVPLLVLGVLYLKKGVSAQAGAFWTGSILVKLTPLVLAPLFWWRKDTRRRWVVFIIPALLLGASALWMLPTWSELASGRGLGVYFKSFEFNASLYYLTSRAFEWGLGYNPISFLGPIMALISGAFILLVSYRGVNSNIWETILLIYLVYYSFATTVHPWYIIPVVFFALAANRPLVLIWSFTAWFSYSHYLQPEGPKWWWIISEYALLAGAIIAETLKKPWFQLCKAALRG